MFYDLFYHGRHDADRRAGAQPADVACDRAGCGGAEVVETPTAASWLRGWLPATAAPEPLERMVAEGRVLPPTASGPLPMPPILGDPGIDVAGMISALRDEERW